MFVKKVLFYSFGKVLELGGLAFILFFIAGQVTPEEYATLMPYMLAISISTMLYSGVGGSFVKEFSLCEPNEQQVKLKLFLSQSIVIAVISSSLLSIFFHDFELLVLLYLSVFTNAFRSFGQSYYRAKLDEKSLVKFNFIYPVITILIYATLFKQTELHPIKLYVICSAIGLSGSAFYVVRKYLVKLKPVVSVQLRDWKLPLRHLFLNMAVFLIVILDKFLVLNFEKSSFVGAYQLYENFSNLFYMGVSSLLFLCTPVLLKKLKKNKGVVFFKYQFGFILVVVFTGFLYSLISTVILQIYFPEYTEYLFAFLSQLSIKVSVILMYLPSVFYMYRNEEFCFSSIIYKILLIFAVLSVLMMFFVSKVDTSILLYSLASLTFTCAIFMNFKVFKDSEK
jgi:hypothetical protein